MNTKIFFLRIYFDHENVIDLCSAGYDIDFQPVSGGLSSNFKSVGDALKIKDVSLNQTLDDKSATITLDASNKYISQLKIHKYIGAQVTIYSGEYDQNGTQVSRRLLSTGQMRKPSVIKTSKKTEIKITISNIFIDLKRKRGLAAVDGSHRLRPNCQTDIIFKYADEFGDF